MAGLASYGYEVSGGTIREIARGGDESEGTGWWCMLKPGLLRVNASGLRYNRQNWGDTGRRCSGVRFMKMSQNTPQQSCGVIYYMQQFFRLIVYGVPQPGKIRLPLIHRV